MLDFDLMVDNGKKEAYTIKTDYGDYQIALEGYISIQILLVINKILNFHSCSYIFGEIINTNKELN